MIIAKKSKLKLLSNLGKAKSPKIFRDYNVDDFKNLDLEVFTVEVDLDEKRRIGYECVSQRTNKSTFT